MEKLINLFNSFLEKKDYESANQIAERMIRHTTDTYNRYSLQYQNLRHESLPQPDVELWEKSLVCLNVPYKEITCLDVGSGDGRDMYYGNKILSIKTYGIDNSSGFIQILRERAREGDFDESLIFEGDMRNMSCFSDNCFHIIRSNASLLHLPIIQKGYMADAAVAEFYRTLKPNGVLCLLLKGGKGFQIVDTGENLGKRFYQFYNRELVYQLLERNGFEIVYYNIRRSPRLDYYIDWIDVIAKKVIL